MNGTLLFFMALAWLIGFIHGWFGRGYNLKHKWYYERAESEQRVQPPRANTEQIESRLP